MESVFTEPEPWWETAWFQSAIVYGPILFGILTSIIWQQKGGRGFSGFLLGLFLGPIGMLYAGLASPQPRGDLTIAIGEGDIVQTLFALKYGKSIVPKGTNFAVLSVSKRHLEVELPSGVLDKILRKHVRLVKRASDVPKTCPQCAEEVKPAAKVCRFCGHEFKPHDVSPSEMESVQKPT